MPIYPNFYENVQEAKIRLNNTVVMYDRHPYYVLGVSDHKSDGIIRIYLDPLNDDKIENVKYYNSDDPIPGSGNYETFGGKMDAWLTRHPESKILRKHMTSPLFDRFRPFPLGMMNRKSGLVGYVERSPTRKTEQGLISSMLNASRVCLDRVAAGKGIGMLEVTTPEMKDCILGNYPSVSESLQAVTSPEFENEAIGFAREFAFVRGPIDTVFLAYKGDIVGSLPKADFSAVRLGKRFTHTKEVIDNLRLFNDIQM